jgi:CXXC-20-CXXC protein
MPTCQKCGRQWLWRQTVKSLLQFRMICPHCDNRQYLTAGSKLKAGMFGLIPMNHFPIIGLFNIPWWTVGVLMTPLLLVIFVIFPYLIEVSNEEEPLW